MKQLLTKYRALIVYAVFGALTTVVNIAVYGIATRLGMATGWANALAWVLSVLFAYFTNRRWVFESRASGAARIAAEFAAFVASRLFSGAVETGLLWLLVDVCSVSENIAKFPVAVLTVVLNYITGKLLVFRKR